MVLPRGEMIRERRMSQRDSIPTESPEDILRGKKRCQSFVDKYISRESNEVHLKLEKIVTGTFLNSRTAAYGSNITKYITKMTQLMPIYNSQQLGPEL